MNSYIMTRLAFAKRGFSQPRWFTSFTSPRFQSYK